MTASIGRVLSCAALFLLALVWNSFAPVPAQAAFGLGDGGYGALRDGGRVIEAVPLDRIPRRYRRQEVGYSTKEKPGTVIVDLSQRYLYLVLSERRALRYGIGTGRAALAWTGEAKVGRKAAWPRWTPTPDMMKRAAGIGRYRDGVDPGAFNPLGARALYLHAGGRDTLYRIHGTAEWWSIGDSASAGCVRLLNQDMIDLYGRVSVGARVIVQGNTMPGVLIRR